MVREVDRDLGGRLHEVAAPVGVGVVDRQQRAIALEQGEQAAHAVRVDHQRSPSVVMRRR